MKAMRNLVVVTALIIMAVPVMFVFAEPLHKEVHFTINVPFEMPKSGMVLDEGKYILYQVSKNDLNLFWLYKENKMHSPIGVVQTVRIDYSSRRYPQETMMLLDTDVESSQAIPVITGWTIPGMDGWEIVGTKIDRDRAQRSHHARSHHALSGSRRKGEVIVKVTTANF